MQEMYFQQLNAVIQVKYYNEYTGWRMKVRTEGAFFW